MHLSFLQFFQLFHRNAIHNFTDPSDWQWPNLPIHEFSSTTVLRSIEYQSDNEDEDEVLDEKEDDPLDKSEDNKKKYDAKIGNRAREALNIAHFHSTL